VNRKWLLVFSILFCATAFAEGRCPPGMYPIDAIGVAACAPIPGAQSPPRPPAPPPREISTWGAIATEAVSGMVGTAIVQRSEQEAHDLAVARCNERALAKKCAIVLTYSNQCGALAWGNGYISGGAGLTPELARFQARHRCEGANGGVQCKIFHVECSMPIRF
jgi:hypothetical protein